MSDYRIEHGLRAEFLESAADIYEEAFGPKTGLVIKDVNVRRRVFLKLMDPAMCICAVEDGRLLGIAGYQTAEKSFAGGFLGRGMTFRTAVRMLPFGAAIRAWFVSQVFERRPQKGELMLDGIAVTPEARGRGCGGAMLSELVKFAGTRGYTSVSLKVIDTNPRAFALYLRHGFKPVKTEEFEYLRGTLGFGAATTMSIPTLPFRPNKPDSR